VGLFQLCGGPCRQESTRGAHPSAT
jgi:hypothetical protein